MPLCAASDSASNTSFAQRFAISATAAAIAEFCTYPLDITRTHLQLRNNGGCDSRHLISTRVGSESPTNGCFCTIRRIYQRQGFAGFYRGVQPAVARAVFNNGMSVSIYKPMLSLVCRFSSSDHQQSTVLHKIAAASITGGATQLMANPVDILKVRLQADAKLVTPQYNTVSSAFRDIASGGLGNFWCGIVPAISRSAVCVAATMATYDHSKQTLLQRHWPDSVATHVVASAVSGFVATLSSCPADVLKTRMMSQASNPLRPLQCRSMRGCARCILQGEGVMSLYSGFLPAYSRLAPWQIIFFISLEQTYLLVTGTSF